MHSRVRTEYSKSILNLQHCINYNYNDNKIAIRSFNHVINDKSSKFEHSVQEKAIFCRLTRQ
jgi:hypothetical protein